VHIVSASRRTDIPAFYAEWFMQRIRSGKVGVKSPFGRGLSEVSLIPEDVIAIVFWTKDAGPLLPYLGELRDIGHCFTFLYTINNYPALMEPRVPSLTHTLEVVEKLRSDYSPPVFTWRYDTIVLTDCLNRRWHVDNFRRLCGLLSSHTDTCIFSFCDYYRKTVRNMEGRELHFHIPDESEQQDIVAEMALIAEDAGIALASCAHDYLVSPRVRKARCIDPQGLARLVDTSERRSAVAGLRTAATRKDCACVASKDIGAYDTCLHGCAYCYANVNSETALKNWSALTPEGSSLDAAKRSSE
jgi:hypothetical protein